IVCRQQRLRVLWISALFIVAGLVFAVLVGVISLTMKPVGGGDSTPGMVFAMLFSLGFAALGGLFFLFFTYAYLETLDKARQVLTLERRRVVGSRIRHVPFGDITGVSVDFVEQTDDHDVYVVFLCRSTGKKIAVGDRDCEDRDRQEELARVLRS